MNKTSLGNSDGIIVFNDVKSKIIDYLYSKINLSKYRFIMLDNIGKLKQLQDNKHYVAPNYKGYSYFLIFITIETKKYCVAINRKKLSYHKEQLDMKNVFMVQIHMNVHDNFYNGTILDGKLIQNTNEAIFLIQDSFYLFGKNMLNMGLMEKITHLDNILKQYMTGDNYCKNFNFRLNKLYEYSDLPDLVYNILPTLQIPVNGITFIPPLSGITIVHIENKTEKISINTSNEAIQCDSYDMIHNFVNYLKNRTYSYETNGNKKQLLLSKTEIPDVYSVFDEYNTERLGIAHIPNLKISHYCNQYIKNTPILFNCVYCTKFRKWIPISICNFNKN
jgi:hypothetical protein